MVFLNYLCSGKIFLQVSIVLTGVLCSKHMHLNSRYTVLERDESQLEACNLCC